MENHENLKSEDEMEIMMMMQQMEKIPEFCRSLGAASDLSHPHSDCVVERLQNHNLGSSGWRRNSGGETELQKQRSVAAMREMIFRIAVMQPIHIDPETVKPPKRRNVKISTDPQSVAARHRRERISERIRILQRLVPGGTKMDTASMLDEAIHYVKFLKTQVQSLERAAANTPPTPASPAPVVAFPFEMSSGSSYVASPPPPHSLQQFNSTN